MTTFRKIASVLLGLAATFYLFLLGGSLYFSVAKDDLLWRDALYAFLFAGVTGVGAFFLWPRSRGLSTSPRGAQGS
jgi:hypothetical protein